MAYSKLAYIYDILMDDAPYDDWQAFVQSMVNKYLPHANKMLDLGCGTGELSNRFTTLGYQVTGVDYSEDMLAYAQEQSNKLQHRVHYIQQDIRLLNGLSGFDVSICLCDVLNYIVTEEDVRSVFNNAYKSLKVDGLFMFDVHSIKHMEESLANQTFAEIYDDVSYVWFCEKGEEIGEVIHDLTFFIQEDGNKYERFDEIHHQRTFSVEIYKQLLKEAGFTLLSMHTDFSMEQDVTPENGERIFFVCQKQESK
ncbi:class I SAM-dependent DNA methyltransferase [Gracilibacillus marinus]|jgi:2-polyprenyl-3-methyl-5-hydroxy-6-metoxy-1,4-benzoquinol methylase|uniref:Class I SAM-dependent DNA methyltransferase n=1 Tax=Gracilibacillus marinus TaxID=630535 RepID=A0ABV8VW77_9BACI